MRAIDSIGISYLDPAISRALVPVQSQEGVANSQREPALPPVPPVIPSGEQRSVLETRAELLQQRSFSNDNTTNRNQQALRAYRSLSEERERDQISQLLGVDEYA
jgi:hypothetical protein